MIQPRLPRVEFAQPAVGPVALQVAWFGLCFITATVVALGTITLLAGRSTRRSF